MSNHQHEIYWYLAPATETGWKCCGCDYQPGEPPGYDAHRDRAEIWTKVWCILNDLHDREVVYVSNGTGGDAIVTAAAGVCKERGLYDQYSIVATILECMNETHGGYWQRVGDGVRSGNDPRARCACGALATVSIGTKDGWLRRCRNCDRDSAW